MEWGVEEGSMVADDEEEEAAKDGDTLGGRFVEVFLGITFSGVRRMKPVGRGG